MDERILKLRGFDLRWVLLITFVSAFALEFIFFKNDFNMGVGVGLTLIPSVLFFITLVVHSIDRDDVALTTSKIALGLYVLGFIVCVSAFGDMPTLSQIDGFDFLFGKSNFEVWAENQIISSAPYSAISSILGICACGYLLKYVNKTYKGVWVMLTILVSVEALAACVLLFGGPSYLSTHTAITFITIPLSFAPLILTFVAASKENKLTHVIQKTSKVIIVKEEPQLSKTELLFQLKELLDGGVLRQEEFDIEKKKILNS